MKIIFFLICIFTLSAKSMNYADRCGQDQYNPNVKFRNLEYLFIENKIILLLNKDIVTEQDVLMLRLFAHTEIPDHACVAKDIWGKLLNTDNLSEFNEMKSSICDAIHDRFENAEFTYKTDKGNLVNLSGKRTGRLSPNMLQYLHQCSETKRYFDQLDLKIFKEKNEETVKDVDDLDRSTIKRCVENDLYSIGNTIQSIRFFSEFNNASLAKELELELEKKLFAVKVQLYGLTLLQWQNNNHTEEEIHTELNRLMFIEEDPIKIAALIKNGADVNAIHSNGLTVLGRLFSRNPLNISLMAAVLLDAGIDVDRGSFNDNPTLWFFSTDSRASVEVLERIAKKSTNIDVTNRSGETVLQVALQAYNPNISCIRALLLAGASHTVKDRTGNTPLMQAASKNFTTDAVKWMMELNKEGIDIQNNNGDTALMIALKQLYINDNTIKIIEMLISAGINIHLTNEQGENAIDLAKKIKYPKDRQLILEKLRQGL